MTKDKLTFLIIKTYDEMIKGKWIDNNNCLREFNKFKCYDNNYYICQLCKALSTLKLED